MGRPRRSETQVATTERLLSAAEKHFGENGFDLALKLGLASHQILKVGNWLGPLFVAAAESEVKKLLVLGYHGKLVKLAGGIFHTHHHLADGR